MKLLKKQVINAQIADQRKNQIEEGLNLAKKIDALRNDLLNLQKQRLDFIENSTREMKQVLIPLYEKKEKLEQEIKSFEEVRNKLKDKLEKAIHVF